MYADQIDKTDLEVDATGVAGPIRPAGCDGQSNASCNRFGRSRGAGVGCGGWQPAEKGDRGSIVLRVKETIDVQLRSDVGAG
jgi:hypothetical protein